MNGTQYARLRLDADKYHIDNTISRELHPHDTITLSAYEHIVDPEVAETTIGEF